MTELLRNFCTRQSLPWIAANAFSFCAWSMDRRATN